MIVGARRVLRGAMQQLHDMQPCTDYFRVPPNCTTTIFDEFDGAMATLQAGSFAANFAVVVAIVLNAVRTRAARASAPAAKRSRRVCSSPRLLQLSQLITFVGAASRLVWAIDPVYSNGLLSITTATLLVRCAEVLWFVGLVALLLSWDIVFAASHPNRAGGCRLKLWIALLALLLAAMAVPTTILYVAHAVSHTAVRTMYDGSFTAYTVGLCCLCIWYGVRVFSLVRERLQFSPRELRQSLLQAMTVTLTTLVCAGAVSFAHMTLNLLLVVTGVTPTADPLPYAIYEIVVHVVVEPAWAATLCYGSWFRVPSRARPKAGASQSIPADATVAANYSGEVDMLHSQQDVPRCTGRVVAVCMCCARCVGSAPRAAPDEEQLLSVFDTR